MSERTQRLEQLHKNSFSAVYSPVHEHNFVVELCQARRKHGRPAVQAPFSHILVFGHVKDFFLPNMLPSSLFPTPLQPSSVGKAG